MSTTATTASRIAHLSNSDRDDYQHIVHGVAHGEDELTLGKNSPKFWPAKEVKAAAATLEGKPIYRSHDGDREQIGTVLRAAYEDGVGVVYEAGLEDEATAEELSLGKREVSIEAVNPDTVDRHEETGAAIMRGYEYGALTTPERGASPGNYTAAGPADQNPAVAALSAAAVEAALDGEDVDVESALTGADLAVDAADLLSAATDASRTDDPTGARPSGSDSLEDNMSDSDNNTNHDIEALLEERREKDERIESLESDLEETQAELEAKEEKVEELEDEVNEAKRDIAARLAEHSDILDEDDYVERFEIAELREKVDDLDEDIDTDADPDVQSGSGGGSGSAHLEDDDRDRIEEIEAKLSAVGGALPRSRVEELEEEAAELAGTDDYEAALEAI
jgi:hypothetical protein